MSLKILSQISDRVGKDSKLGNPFNLWFTQTEVEAYVRRSRKVITPFLCDRIGDKSVKLIQENPLGRSTVSTLELANFSVKPKFQRRGICKALLSGLEQIADEYRLLFLVESVLNPNLESYLKRIGYKTNEVHQGSGEERFISPTPTYYKV